MLGKIQGTNSIFFFFFFFGGGVYLTPCIQGFFYIFQGNLCLWATFRRNKETDFHEILRTGQTWGKKRSGSFSGSWGQLFESGIDFLFSGSVFVRNLMEKRVNGFSYNWHDKSGTTISHGSLLPLPASCGSIAFSVLLLSPFSLALRSVSVMSSPSLQCNRPDPARAARPNGTHP